MQQLYYVTIHGDWIVKITSYWECEQRMMGIGLQMWGKAKSWRTSCNIPKGKWPYLSNRWFTLKQEGALEENKRRKNERAQPRVVTGGSAEQCGSELLRVRFLLILRMCHTIEWKFTQVFFFLWMPLHTGSSTNHKGFLAFLLYLFPMESAGKME